MNCKSESSCPEWLQMGGEFAHSHTVLHSGVKWNSKPSAGLKARVWDRKAQTRPSCRCIIPAPSSLVFVQCSPPPHLPSAQPSLVSPFPSLSRRFCPCSPTHGSSHGPGPAVPARSALLPSLLSRPLLSPCAGCGAGAVPGRARGRELAAAPPAGPRAVSPPARTAAGPTPAQPRQQRAGHAGDGAERRGRAGPEAPQRCPVHPAGLQTAEKESFCEMKIETFPKQSPENGFYTQ